MKEIQIGQNDSGQRLDRFLAKAVPLLPASLAQKYIRIKRIKLNGGRAERDTRLQPGISLHPGAVTLDALDADIFLGQGSRQQGNRLRKKTIQSLTGIVGADGKFFHNVLHKHLALPLGELAPPQGGD